MQWLAMQNLWFLAVIPAILLLYLLKKKYDPLEISSVLLWEKVLGQQEANRPWQRLRNNLLLLLQLLAALLLILALLKPAIPATGTYSAHTVVVIDSSASMLTQEEAGARFALAKEQVTELIHNLNSKQAITLLEAGREPHVLVANSSDKQELLAALEQLEARPIQSNLAAAFSLAVAIAQTEEDTSIIWFGDGDQGEIVAHPQWKALGDIPFQQINPGSIRENIALSAFITQEEAGQVNAFLRLDNYGERKRQGTVQIKDQAGQLLELFSFSIPAQDSYVHTLPGLAWQPAYLAQLEVEGDGLAEDNQRWSVPFAQVGVKAVLVSPEGNPFLQQAIALSGRINVERMNRLPENFDPTVDVWIFDGVVPEQLPEGNLLLVGAGEKRAWLPFTGWQEAQQAPKMTESKHVIREHVDFSPVYVAQYANYAFDSNMEAVAQIDGKGMVYAGQLAGRKAVVLGFDLFMSDFPLRPAFPIFIQDVLEWLTPIQSLPLGTSYPGEMLQLPLTPGASERTVLTPAGQRIELAGTGTTASLLVPEELGLYQLVEKKDGEELIRYFTVHLPEQESDITPIILRQPPKVAQEEKSMGEAEKAETGAEGTASEAKEAATERDTNQGEEPRGWRTFTEWWALFAFCLILIEWGLYQRGY